MSEPITNSCFLVGVVIIIMQKVKHNANPGLTIIPFFGTKSVMWKRITIRSLEVNNINILSSIQMLFSYILEAKSSSCTTVLWHRLSQGQPRVLGLFGHMAVFKRSLSSEHYSISSKTEARHSWLTVIKYQCSRHPSRSFSVTRSRRSESVLNSLDTLTEEELMLQESG